MSVTLNKVSQIVRTGGIGSLIKLGCSRLWAAPSAWVALQRQPQFQDLDELLNYADKSFDGLMRPVQVRSEIRELLEVVQERRPQVVVEIGTWNGGTLFLWTRIASEDAHLVSIDLPGGQFGGGYAGWRVPIFRSFARGRQKLDLLRVDSHSTSTVEQIKRLLNGRTIDFLFLDGDHTYDGVKKDWDLYSPMVTQGGVIAFHDVASSYDNTQVKRFWDGIKSAFPHREYLADPDGRFGIGVLFFESLNPVARHVVSEEMR